VRAHFVSPLLLLAAVPFMRPFVFGERLSAVGIVLASAAAAIAIIDDRGTQAKIGRSTRSLLLWASLLWVWSLLQLSWLPGSLESALRGLADGPAVLLAAVVVLREDRRRLIALRGLIGVLLASCISFVITYLLWRVNGYGTSLIARLPSTYKSVVGTTSVFFPFTATSSSYTFGSTVIPRFLGIGREPGVGAAILGWAFFMVPRIGWRRRWQLLIVAGLLGTQSTAGFGVFLIIWVIDRFIVPRRMPWTLGSAVKQWIGIALLFAATWLAVYAPFGYGLQAKQDLNAVSYDTRLGAMERGLHAISRYPFGQALRSDQLANAGINLIAAITLIGIPGLVLAILLFYLPFARSSVRAE
jgi:hypothetical protein